MRRSSSHYWCGLAGKEESAFIKVHDPDFIRGKKRLYMTATPRLYSDDAKGKAAEADALLCSMDDPNMYGEEIYRLGFGEAVEKGLLTDYKVIILTLNDNDVPLAVQRLISGAVRKSTLMICRKLSVLLTRSPNSLLEMKVLLSPQTLHR